MMTTQAWKDIGYPLWGFPNPVFLCSSSQVIASQGTMYNMISKQNQIQENNCAKKDNTKLI